MPINDAVPAPPPHGTLPPCPRCALTDQVRSVPAVHLSERRNVTVRSSGRDGRTETREEVSALGRALAPAPPTATTAFKAMLVLAFPALFATVETFSEGMRQRNASGEHQPDFSPPSWWKTGHPGFPNGLPTGYQEIGPSALPSPTATQAAAPLADTGGTPTVLVVSFLLMALVLGLVAGAVTLYVTRRRRLAGRPRAERLWNQAWYCARCGTAHFPPTAGQGTGALGLAEFRKAVWTAGGYGDLAERYRP
ncbi:hypothetical protein ACH4E7_45295 [Kitasatospora sp. NPDC018058]|uniref:hypothetical protein n=1 Tax=Kitasatospora sp. NPDC018058 TaxID=3364025 RepID=UPI0037BEF0B8